MNLESRSNKTSVEVLNPLPMRKWKLFSVNASTMQQTKLMNLNQC